MYKKKHTVHSYSKNGGQKKENSFNDLESALSFASLIKAECITIKIFNEAGQLIQELKGSNEQHKWKGDGHKEKEHGEHGHHGHDDDDHEWESYH